MTFKTMLSLVTDSIVGPGNCPLISMPYIFRKGKKEGNWFNQWTCEMTPNINIWTTETEQNRKFWRWNHLLRKTKGRYCSICHCPCKESICVFRIYPGNTQKSQCFKERIKENSSCHSMKIASKVQVSASKKERIKNDSKMAMRKIGLSSRG